MMDRPVPGNSGASGPQDRVHSLVVSIAPIVGGTTEAFLVLGEPCHLPPGSRCRAA